MLWQGWTKLVCFTNQEQYISSDTYTLDKIQSDMDRTHEAYSLTALNSSLTNLLPQMSYLGNINLQYYNEIKFSSGAVKLVSSIYSHKVKFWVSQILVA
jgi:hypothetical protein